MSFGLYPAACAFGDISVKPVAHSTIVKSIVSALDHTLRVVAVFSTVAYSFVLRQVLQAAYTAIMNIIHKNPLCRSRSTGDFSDQFSTQAIPQGLRHLKAHILMRFRHVLDVVELHLARLALS